MPIYKMDGKRDGKQKYRVRINYVDNAGISRQIDRVTYGMTEAKILEEELQKKTREKALPAMSNITIRQLYDEYIKVKSVDVRKTTLDKTMRILNGNVLPYFANIRLDKLNARMLQDWKLRIAERDLSTVTKQNIYGEFRALLNYAVRMEYLMRNPLGIVGNFKESNFELPKDKLRYYTPEQFKAFIAVARDAANSLTDWGYYVFFCIAFYTGMRKGEINALKWSDIEGNFIHVRRSIAQKVKGGDIETLPKNKTSYRTLQMPIPLIDILSEHKQRQAKAPGFSEDFRVCGGIACLRDTSIAKRNVAFSDAAGLPHIRIHDFRHSHASLLANEGINIQEIARRLGHSKIEITWNTYSHLYPREEERAVQILNKIV